jgi:uncharacterized membrane protein YedE/YeeE
MPPPAPPKLPLIMLGLLTLATIGGPLLILAAILGGPSAKWPPDRAIEWVVLVGVIATVVVLMTACVTCGVWAKPAK